MTSTQVGNWLFSNLPFIAIHDTYTGCLTGFIDIGDINCHLADYERQLSNDDIRDPLASSMLVLMVRGLFTTLKFAYTQFPCINLSQVLCYEIK